VLLASLCALTQAKDTESSQSTCAASSIASADLTWAEAGDRVLPTLVAHSAEQNAVCKPFSEGVLTCHILLTGQCSRLVVASDLERWHVHETDLARKAIANLDRLAAPISLNPIWLGDGLPEVVSHSSAVGTAAAWVLTTSFQEKIRTLQPGAWFVAMPQSDYIFAWPVGQSIDVVTLHLNDLKNQLSLAATHSRVLTGQVFVLLEGRLRAASPEEVHSGHIAAVR